MNSVTSETTEIPEIIFSNIAYYDFLRKNRDKIHYNARMSNIKSEKELCSFLEKEEVCKILPEPYYSILKSEIRIDIGMQNSYTYRKESERRIIRTLPLLRSALSSNDLDTVFELLSECGPSKLNSREFSYEVGLSMRGRDSYTEFLSWSIIDRDTMTKISEFIGDKKALEIGAGNALITTILRLLSPSIDITVTDNFSSHTSEPDKCFTRVEEFDSDEAIREFTESQILILIWPPSHTKMSSNALRKFKGKYVIYIGEDEDGCTGDKGFHKILEKEWNDLRIDTPLFGNWCEINDCVYFYERNEDNADEFHENGDDNRDNNEDDNRDNNDDDF